MEAPLNAGKEGGRRGKERVDAQCSMAHLAKILPASKSASLTSSRGASRGRAECPSSSMRRWNSALVSEPLRLSSYLDVGVGAVKSERV